ncbi:hypothetical protein P8891_05760 [Bacillus atrophaeus]|uniref:hypothetical protein n=1 Tax=Bacillus atrophaeus TaxID=1452 RepID=UPI002282DDE5|nr:hypothetical protein [Bacillus atrophaeus]MCY7947939.1 hypothetical protein [Bacillus atrophaeus]MCY8098262.1 hypothetical protein [Bacillus atrophaeus]MCY9170039.1 hypothetical protein [Bacillus atrophaeus]MEC0740593.1 hypothetical protein [Bacillus atrophaeus]MEC0746971.1 hypothetical protein [Bacillus atrophaeus]
MKKLLSLGVAVIGLSGVFTGGFISNLNEKVETHYIVEENGFKVVKDANLNQSTIVAKVKEIESDKSADVQNIFDKDDLINLDETDPNVKTLKEGDNVLVTFDGDQVYKVEKYDPQLKKFIEK